MAASVWEPDALMDTEAEESEAGSTQCGPARPCTLTLPQPSWALLLGGSRHRV